MPGRVANLSVYELKLSDENMTAFELVLWGKYLRVNKNVLKVK